MKFDMHLVMNVIIALVIFKILDKLFLDKLTDKVPSLMGLELDSLEIA